jgi:hypothetical protein
MLEMLMQVSTDIPSAKPTRSKVKNEAATAAPKKARSRKKVVEQAASVPQPDVLASPASDEIEHMIATAAYYLAAQRNFSPGRELDDWLAAERQVRSQRAG